MPNQGPPPVPPMRPEIVQSWAGQEQGTFPPSGITFVAYRPEFYVDQGGPCGHSDPFTGADDCLCRDGYVIPAGFDEATTSNYCDGPEPLPPF